MAKITLPNRAVQAVVYINAGRIGLFTPGGESEGRILWQGGINRALTVFQETQLTADPRIILLVEIAFLEQELNFADESDKKTITSLTAAIQSFKNAIACLKIVEKPESYKNAEITFPDDDKFRIKTYPKDAMHFACSAHWTRLQNIIRAPGVNMQEKAVLEQRAANMKTAQTYYMKKQQKALTAKKGQVLFNAEPDSVMALLVSRRGFVIKKTYAIFVPNLIINAA